MPRFPAVERDIAIVVDVDAQSGDIAKTIKKAGKHLENVKLFDVYRGSHMEKGKKSLAYKMHFRAEDRTLTDEEVQKSVDKILAALEQQFGAQIRK